MSGGYKSSVPSEVGWLLEKLNRQTERIKTLETRLATVGVANTANSVILTDANGVQWRLGVTTSGATTWTQV